MLDLVIATPLPGKPSEAHEYLSQWLEFVPAEMQVIPLMDSHAMGAYLASPTP